MNTLASNPSTTQAKVCVPSDFAMKHSNCFALEVDGYCMAPTVPNGSFVVVDPDSKPQCNGQEMAALEIRGTYYLGRPLRIMNQIVVIHDNRNYRNVVFPERAVRLIGVVISVVKADVPNYRSHARMGTGGNCTWVRIHELK